MQATDPYSDVSDASDGYGSTSEYDDLARKLQKKRDIDLQVDSLERDWNEEYQFLLAKEESYEKYKSLSNLAQDFVYASKLYAQVIISELCLPDEKKTIKPKNIGGVAGGTKYVCQGILFKLALDRADSNAMKACGHDLKGLSAVYDTGMRDIHLPLICIIDYRGFRVVAMSLLPICGDETIIYGSSNAGRSVCASDEKFNKLVKSCAKMLNLKEHIGGEVDQKRIYMPVDIEGHLGSDKRYYLLDFARLMPPQVKIKKTPEKTYLFELLRPELVATNPCPLSSDAGTPLGKFDPEQPQHTAEITAACKRLFTQVIPAFAKFLKVNCPDLVSTTERVVEELHRFGINVRHLGFVRRLLTEEPIRRLLLTEMVARVLKDRIYEILRTKMRQIKVASEQPYKYAVLEFLNEIFVTHVSEFWQSEVKKFLEDKFMMGLSVEESGPLYNLLDHVDVPALLARFQQIAAISLRADSVTVLSSGSSELVASDVKEIGARARVMNIVLHSEAYCVAIEASRRQGTEALRLYLHAHQLFQEVVAKSPRHPAAFFRWAKMLHSMALQPIFQSHSRRLLCDGAIRRLRCVIEWDPKFVDAHLELISTCMDYLFNYPRLSGIHRRHVSDTQAVLENTEYFNMISASLCAILTLSPDDIGDRLQRFVSIVAVTERHDVFAAWAQALLQTSPELITPFLQRCARLQQLVLDECCMLNKSTLVFVIRNCGDLTSLSIRDSWDLDVGTLRTILDYASRLELVRLDNCDRLEAVPTNIPPSLKTLELIHTGVSNAGLTSLAAHSLNSLTMLRLSGSRELVTDSGLDALLRAAPNIGRLHLGACNDMKWSSAFNYQIKNPTLLGSLPLLQDCSLSGCRDIHPAAVSALLNKSTNLTKLSLAGAGQLDEAIFVQISRRCLSLVELDVSKTSINTHAMKSIASSCTSLTELRAHLCPEVHPSALETFLAHCPRIQYLDCSYWKDDEDTSESLRGFILHHPAAPLPNPHHFRYTLTCLNLCNWQHLNSDIASALITQYGRNLTILDVSNDILLDDAFLAAVAATCGKLEKLYLTNLMLIGDVAFSIVAKANAATLRTLYLISCTKLTDASLIALAPCVMLQKLELRGLNKITSNGIQQLLQRNTKMKYLGLRQSKLVTGEFLRYKLRHNCPYLQIALEGPKQILLDLKL